MIANSATPIRVLVVDDDPLICWAIAETLCACGTVATKVCTAEAAIGALTAPAAAINVVLLDCLPDSRGLNLLAKIKQLAPYSQVIVMSAFYTPRLAQDALDHGACRVVSKPLDMHDVPALVRDAARLNTALPG
jgi:DNA-binding NtrC family response regulator